MNRHQFLEKFIPEDTNINEKRELDGFSMMFGYNYENTDINRPLDDRPIDLSNLLEIDYLNPSCTDNYFTPNLFRGNKYSMINRRRKLDELCWLQSFYLDIDGIKGVKDPEKAKNKLYKVLEKAGIPYPDILLHTSTNPTVRLQAFWLHDPIWVYDSRKGQVDNFLYRKWWNNIAEAITEIVPEIDSDFQIDYKASTDLTSYMRLPGGYNQKTGEKITVLDHRQRKNRFTLEDNWIKNLLEKYNKLQNSKLELNSDTNIDLLNHNQIQELLKGVPEGYRNYSQYAIALACKHDGLSQKEAINILLKQNKRCDPPERETKVKSLVKSAYRSDYGLSAKKVAWIVEQITGEKTEIDYKLYTTCRDSITVFDMKDYKRKYIPKQEMINRAVTQLLKLIRDGAKILPATAKLAQMINVSKSSLSRVWKQIINIIQNSARVKLDKSCHYHHKYIVLEQAEKIIKNQKVYNNQIDINRLETILNNLNLNYSIVKMLKKKTDQELESFIRIIAKSNSPPKAV